jgi:hypothetical protein
MDKTVNCLWIGRDIPIPESTGDRIYSGRLATALAEAEFRVHFLGLVDPDADLTQSNPTNFTWIPIWGQRKSYRSVALSALPLAAAVLNTHGMRDRLRAELHKDWEVIVLDNYATAWALTRVLAYRRRRAERTVLVYVSHNHETELAKTLQEKFRGPRTRRLFLALNYLKIRRIERKLLTEAELISSITEEDAAAFKPFLGKSVKQVVLTPGYSGNRVASRTIQSSHRRVVLVGSFRWVVKQQNLRELLDAADNIFASLGIALDIVGDTPDEIIAEYDGVLKATKFHGFVDDYTSIFQAARIAIVPETVGGGFKLKILDYIFNRLPVAALSQASAGLPPAIRSNFIIAETIHELIQEITRCMDRLDQLDKMQSSAFDAACNLFEWSDRGENLRMAIRSSYSQAAQ